MIQRLTRHLAAMEWPEIDLMLRQFGLPWSETWEGNKDSYLIEHLQSASDESLIELDNYLEGGGVEEERVRAARQWTTDRFRLFVSHTSSNKEFMGEFKEQLERFGIEAFVAHADINPAKEWLDEIEAAIESCHALLAYLTSDFPASNWTDQEVGMALRRRILLIPVRVDLNPYGFLGRWQALPGTGKTASELAEAIFKVLVGHQLSAPEMAGALVAQLEESTSFLGARRNISLVEQVKVWTPELLRRLEEAEQKNLQVSSSWGVPNRIRALIQAHSR